MVYVWIHRCMLNMCYPRFCFWRGLRAVCQVIRLAASGETRRRGGRWRRTRERVHQDTYACGEVSIFARKLGWLAVEHSQGTSHTLKC